MSLQMNSTAEALAGCARRQHGLITLTQLRELGVSRGAVRTRITSGQWRPVEWNVLQMEDGPSTWEQQLLASVLAAGDRAVASHRAAARLWGLTGPPSSAAPPEISVPRASGYRRRGLVTVHRLSDLDLVEPAECGGIPVTPVARTLLDLGAVVNRRQVAQAVVGAVRQGSVGWGQLLDTVIAHARRGRDGVAPLRAVLADHLDDLAALPLGIERLVLLHLRNAQLPAMELDHPLVVDGLVHRLGLAIPDDRVALLPLDDGVGRPLVAHTPAEVAAEAAARAGWTVIAFNRRDILRRPAEVVHRVRCALSGPPAGTGPA
jgi:hypothetical protein